MLWEPAQGHGGSHGRHANSCCELLQHQHEENRKVDGLIPSQVESALREMKPGMTTQDPGKNVDKRSLTAMISNLEGISSSQTWLIQKLSVL